MTYEIKKRIIPEKKARLPIFKDIPEREEYYFQNENGVEQKASTLEEAKKLVEENKAFYRMKRETEEWIRNRGKL